MENGTAYLVVYCTCPDQDVALTLANSLIDDALAACVNIMPGLTSVYAWEGQCETDTEALLMIKTTRGRYPALEARIRELHPYELPEIIGVPIDAGLPAYLAWIDNTCQRSME